MTKIVNEDLSEVGRLLGRNGGVLIAHGVLAHRSDWNSFAKAPPETRFRRFSFRLPMRRTAVQQAMNMLRAKDVLLVLAEDPQATVNLIQRRLRRLPPPTRNDPTAAKAS